jgi:hypothetical protein
MEHDLLNTVAAGAWPLSLPGVDHGLNASFGEIAAWSVDTLEEILDQLFN